MTTYFKAGKALENKLLWLQIIETLKDHDALVAPALMNAIHESQVDVLHKDLVYNNPKNWVFNKKHYKTKEALIASNWQNYAEMQKTEYKKNDCGKIEQNGRARNFGKN